MKEKITPQQQVNAAQSTQEAKQGEEQKKSQVESVASAAADQASAKAASHIADAKAAADKLNKELAQIPQKIEATLDDAIDNMQKALGYSPVIKKVKVVKPDGSSIEVPDFDPDKILKDIEKIIDPVMNMMSPVESVVGKIPVIGDIVPVLTKFGTQEFPGENEISMKDVRALVPNPPDFPPSLMQKAKRLLQLVQQFLMMLPIILIDVIFKMLTAIYDMFDQIVGIIGVPPPVFPFNLVKQMPVLIPKVKTLMQQLPTQVDTLIVEKLKKKYQVAMALQMPQPNLGATASTTTSAAASAAKSAASSSASTAAASATSAVSEQPVSPSSPAPVQSNIQQTPSVKPIEPKAPVASQPVMIQKVNLKFEFDGCDPQHTKFQPPDVTSTSTIKKELDECYTLFINACIGNSFEAELVKISSYAYQRIFDQKTLLNDAIRQTLRIFRLDTMDPDECIWICETGQQIDSAGQLDPDGDTYYVTRTIELQQEVTDDVLDLTCTLKQQVRKEFSISDGTTIVEEDAAAPNGWLDDLD